MRPPYKRQVKTGAESITMMVKQLLWLVCALGMSCTSVAAQATSASPTPSPNSKAATASDTVKRAIIPPEKAKPIVVPRFDKPPVIDGKLDDEVWKHAVVLKDFLQTYPGDNIAPSKPTEMMIGYDARTFYMAFHCYDEPDKVRATVAKRDHVFGEDNVRVFLDTFNDQRHASLLGFNPPARPPDATILKPPGTTLTIHLIIQS